jgi:hypothetical protein
MLIITYQQQHLRHCAPSGLPPDDQQSNAPCNNVRGGDTAVTLHLSHKHHLQQCMTRVSYQILQCMRSTSSLYRRAHSRHGRVYRCNVRCTKNATKQRLSCFLAQQRLDKLCRRRRENAVVAVPDSPTHTTAPLCFQQARTRIV